MRYETRQHIKKLAAEIADKLWADLKAKAIPKIGIDEIRAAIFEKAAPAGWNDPDDLEALEEMTTRRIVEKVG